MKTYVELSLVAVLIALLYQPSNSVTLFAKSVLGKAALIIAIVVISHQFGMNAGLLTAIIAVVLLNHTIEGNEDLNLPANLIYCKDKVGEDRKICLNQQNFTNREGMENCKEGDKVCLKGDSIEQPPAKTPEQEAMAQAAATAAGINLNEYFSNYTLDDAADFGNLKSTLSALDSQENIKRSMRAAEYAKTAPAGSAIMTNHLDTANAVNNNSPLLAGLF
jgi:hypothetical protein